MRVLAHVALSWFAAFFVCGAVVFPLLNPYYLDRVAYSGGLAALAYGLESVLRFGHIEACGFISGNCSQHSFRLAGCVLWAVLLAGLALRRSLQAERRSRAGRPDERVDGDE